MPRFGGRSPQAWRHLVLGLVVAAMTLSWAGRAAPKPAPAAVPRDTLRALPFLPATEPGQPVSASRLTRAYERNVMQFVSPVRRSRPTDLVPLDQLAAGPASSPDTAAADSSDIRLSRSRQAEAAGKLTPEEKAAIAPEKPGAHVGIPSPVAATGALIGGFVLLVKLLAELAR